MIKKIFDLGQRKMSNYDSKTINEAMKQYADDILRSPNFRKSSRNVQHGNITVMKHCLKVAHTAMYLNRKYNLKCNERELTRGALLHDYFLYDWHIKDRDNFKPLHGFFHPGIALRNAEIEYDLTDIERDIIKKHMWPMTVIPPKYKEAWVVTTADKIVSTLESLRLQNRKITGE